MITGEGLPLAVVKGLICKEFGWTLNELKEQPLQEVFEVWGALMFYEARLQAMQRSAEHTVSRPRRRR